MSLFSAVRLTTARTQESLEAKTERLHYDVSCSTKIPDFSPQIGDVDFEFSRTGSRYKILTDVETTGHILSILFSGRYNFTTTGHVDENSFLPERYLFTKKDKAGNNLVEVVQKFDFAMNKVESSRVVMNNKRGGYDRTKDIDKNSRDIFSVLMELRTRPLQTYTFQVIEEGEKKPFTFVYMGEESIIIKDKRYDAYKFRVEDTCHLIIKPRQEVFLYLEKDAQRKPLRVSITNYDIGNVVIELGAR